MRGHAVLLFAGIAVCAAVGGRADPYNPYAAVEESQPPVSADGTIHWGVFYKSAKLQQTYERLWGLGACRGSNKAITTPVAENKLVIDRLPEADFHGVVRAVAGGIQGGVLAFVSDPPAGDDDRVLVAQLHPAGVSRVLVQGTVSADAVVPGTTVRLKTTVDTKGRGLKPVEALEIVTPPAGFVPDPIRPGHQDSLVGTVASLRRGSLVLRVDQGTIRRLSLRVAGDATLTVDGTRLDLVSEGDRVEVRGRLWAGDGALEGGTVFASDVVVTKRPGQPASGSLTVGAK